MIFYQINNIFLKEMLVLDRCYKETVVLGLGPNVFCGFFFVIVVDVVVC